MLSTNSSRLIDVISNKNNNFNLIRIIAATAVIFSHSFPLSIGKQGFEPVFSLLGISTGEIAVNIFFITSGFLVTRSLLFRNNLHQFIVARVLRIYPALIISVLFCVLLGLIVSTFGMKQYLTDNEIIKFIIYNSTIIITDYQTLPGVFEQAPYGSSVNGSLWTLPWELRMYLVLLGIGVLITLSKGLKHKINYIILLIAVSSTVINFNYHFNQEVHWFYSKAARFLSAFFLGGCLYTFRHNILLSRRLLLCCCLLLVISFIVSKDFLFISFTLLSPYIVLCIAYLPRGRILNYNKLGDYSYGIYIYAWPIQQTLAISYIGIKPTEMMLFTFILTLTLAIFSWHFIEKPTMGLKKYFM